MNERIAAQHQELHQALEFFEASVESPFVPGEIERWIAAVELAWNRLLPTLNWLITVRHPDEFAEIRQEDQELIRRVQQMRQEDAAIDSAAVELEQRISLIETAISNIEPDEVQVRTTLENFVDDAIGLIIRIRKQELAVRTWLLEALNRDRGTVD
ncbi:MAG: hypothetical protein KDA52_18105 [Planctomycetaceae bacterium]|nr:hypothetical protein [Planctomycetaceae bacterium]